MLSPCRCPRTLCPLARVLASFSMPRVRAGGLRTSCSALGAETELRPAGHLHLIIGPMFAGKTSELLQHLTKHEEAGRRILVAKSDRDRRYAASEVVSHNGLRRPAHAVHSLSSLFGREEYARADVVAVDEAQFFPDLKEFCIRAVDKDHKRVLVAGLDGDFRREPFGEVLFLVPHADVVTKKSGLCKGCSQPSLFSLRTVADSRTELVGGGEAYQPTCRLCYARGLVHVHTAAAAP